MTRIILIALVLVFVALVRPAHAQNPVNPTQVTFDLDPTEFPNLDGVEYGYFTSASATVPVSISALVPKTSGCAVNGAVQTCAESLLSRPTTFGTWFLGVRAAAGTMRSPWSVLVPFDRAPGPPANVKPK